MLGFVNLYQSAVVYPCGAVDSSIRPPGSKSITNRAVICAALAAGESQLSGVLDSEDTQVMIEAWQKVGLELEHDKAAQTLRVVGCGGALPVADASIFVANSGTTMRFLSAALTACQGAFRIEGVPRMHERPIGDLMHALNALGADIRSDNGARPDCPPVLVNASGLSGGKATIKGNTSSQFLSALMMVSPLAAQDVTLIVDGELVSLPYVDMTAAVMAQFGATVEGDAKSEIVIRATGPYRTINYAIEPDASAASYFWGAAAITGGRARVEGLHAGSLQGDIGFCRVLEQMGCKVAYLENAIEVEGGELCGVDVNMADISDTVQTLAAVALFARGDTRVRGVAHNRVKETDRIGDLATELRKFGATVEEHQDGLTIGPPSEILQTEVETYRDHRMAMSLALVGLRSKNPVTILDPDCTSKTYPNYWNDLERFCGCRIDRR